MLRQLVRKVEALVRSPTELATRGVVVPLNYRVNLLAGHAPGPASWRYLPGPAAASRRPATPRVPRRPRVPVGDRRFGQLAVARGMITREHLEEALLRQRVLGLRLGQTLTAMRLLTDHDVARLLSEQSGVPLIELSDFIIDPAIAKLVPEHIAHRHLLIPINKIGMRLSVAMVDPTNVLAVDDIQLMTGLTVQTLVASRTAVQQALIDTYGAQSQLDRVFGDIEDDIQRNRESLEDLQSFGELGENDAPIIRLVNLILTQAAVNGASEILFEPFEREFRVRYRTGGRLRVEMTPPRQAGPAIVQRLKVLASLPAEGSAAARNGTLALRVNNRRIDLDIHVQPTRWGETVNLHIRDERTGDLDALGLENDARQAMQAALDHRDGLIAVAGPQRSGRSTTLVALMREINGVGRQIAHVGHSRVAIHGIHDVLCAPEDGDGFAVTLRTLAHARPDVVVLADLPDRATARAALALLEEGVQVIVRVAAPGPEAALGRLMRMGLARHLRLLSTQRVVPALCLDCRAGWTPPPELWRRHGMEPERAAEARRAFRATGCDRCGRDGYRGSTAVFEVLPISEGNRRGLAKRRSAARVRQVALEEGARTFGQAALDKVMSGLTSFEAIGGLDRAVPARVVPPPPAPDADPFAALRLPVPALPGPLSLVVVQNGQVALRFPLGAGETNIGQRDDLAAIVPDLDLAAYDAIGTIAPQHARITRDGGHYFVHNRLGSTGMQLNGRDVPAELPTPLVAGDVLTLAQSVTLRVEAEPDL